MSHLALMVVYAVLISSFFAVLWRHDARSRGVLFAKMSSALIFGAIALAWLMYLFPSGHPSLAP